MCKTRFDSQGMILNAIFEEKKKLYNFSYRKALFFLKWHKTAEILALQKLTHMLHIHCMIGQSISENTKKAFFVF